MPHRAPRPCPRCGRLVQPGGECPRHPRQRTLTTDTRPSAARRGYDAAWRKKRKAFLERNPYCEDCGPPTHATHADHVPSRRVLIAHGIDNPDADQYLHARCASCHSSKTAHEDGGFGNPIRVGR